MTDTYHCDFSFSIEGEARQLTTKQLRKFLLKWRQVFANKFTVLDDNPDVDIAIHEMGSYLTFEFAVVGQHFMKAKSGSDCSVQVYKFLAHIYNHFNDRALHIKTMREEAISVREYSPPV